MPVTTGTLTKGGRTADRARKLGHVRAKVRNGSLVIRQATAEERADWGNKS